MDQLTEYILKGAEAANTYGMPLSAPTGKGTPVKTIPKTGGERISSLVNTTGKCAPQTVATKTAQQYALPQHERYPLDSYAQVKTACAYFEEHAGQFDLGLRRTFAVNLVKRASELGINAPAVARQYGSTVAADPADLEIAIDGRRGVLGEQWLGSFNDVKVAAMSLPPEAAALLLTEFDKTAGIDHLDGTEIIDPLCAAFKLAAEGDIGKSPEGSVVIGNDYMSLSALKRYAAVNRPALTDMYGEDMADKMQKDPVATFNGLPRAQQKILIRLVNDNGPSGSVND